ncbi:type II secretion system minor pseudopilin GspI [Thioalkalivibrio sp. XN279]|uniref:type II secretion system minor pseudopilin GspI n=1 Tax=Thioalkalivibrio sp. XN279 TaxID=2714953 RepID=UPI00140E02F1|nr:type II secretion system minor pseudopilin GspI [Thioalkalivibrio sp. XN279]NHA14462.1 type II secretion system minor pseudopilin GspI [Thioalkalivibrio sp. XN279]
MRRGRGFTLLEVMVALAIVSIGLIAAFNAVIQMAHSTTTLRERAFADWIAMNQLTELRVTGEFPDVGRFDGDVEFAGREWRWEASVSETGVEDLRRVDISVAYIERPEDLVTLLTGFIGRDSGPAALIDWWGATDAEAAPPGGEGTEEVEPEPANPPPPTPDENEEDE